MSHLQYAAEKAALLASGTTVLFAVDAPPPCFYNPLLANDILSFTIYPTASHHLAANDLLWRVVHARKFYASSLAALLPRNPPQHTPFAIALPMPLTRFLSAVTLSDMRAAVIYMLADAAQGEDPAGLAKMRAELPLSVWRRLTGLMEQTAAQRTAGFGVAEGAPAGITRASFLLDAALQTAPSNDYWKISIEVALAEPMMLGSMPIIRAPPNQREIGRICTRYLLQRQADLLELNSRDVAPKRAHVLLSLYEDWRKYTVICGSCELPRIWKLDSHDQNNNHGLESRYRRALLLLTHLVGTNRQAETWQRVAMLRSCAKEQTSFISWLPFQIVEQILIPVVVIQDGHEAAESLNEIDNRSNCMQLDVPVAKSSGICNRQ